MEQQYAYRNLQSQKNRRRVCLLWDASKKYDIVNQKHQGDRDVGSSLSVDITVLANNQFASDSKLFTGENLLNVDGDTLTVKSVVKQNDGEVIYIHIPLLLLHHLLHIQT